MKSKLMLMAAFASGAVAAAAQPSSLPGSPEEVAQFVSTSVPILALEDVRVIDGTGAPAREAEGRMPGPRMFVTGPNFNGFAGHFVGDDIIRDAAALLRKADPGLKGAGGAEGGPHIRRQTIDSCGQ